MPFDSAREPVPKVQFQVNHLHGLYTFVWTLARRPLDTSPFEGSSFETSELRRLLAEFARLIPFGNSLLQTGASGNLDQLCMVAAGHAGDLDDFRERLMNWMPQTDRSRLADILEQFRPIYDDLIWIPAQPSLRRWQQFLRDHAHRGGLDDLIGRIARFYATPWELMVPFRVLLYPVCPGSRLSCTVASDVVTLSVAGEPCEAARYLGIVTHEVCHGLEENRGPQPGDLSGGAPAGVAESLAVYGRLALDEALATAVGNGWVVAQLTGLLPAGPWYDNWHIQTYATALYPLVDQYLDSGRIQDDAFFERALNTYRVAVGDRMWDYANIFAHVVIVTDEAIRDEESAAARLAGHVDYLANAEELDGVTEENLDRLLKGGATRLAIFRAGDETGLNYLSTRVDWLREIHFSHDEPFVAGKVGEDDPALFVFSVATMADLDDALNLLNEHWITKGVLALSLRTRARTK